MVCQVGSFVYQLVLFVCLICYLLDLLGAETCRPLRCLVSQLLALSRTSGDSSVLCWLVSTRYCITKPVMRESWDNQVKWNEWNDNNEIREIPNTNCICKSSLEVFAGLSALVFCPEKSQSSPQTISPLVVHSRPAGDVAGSHTLRFSSNCRPILVMAISLGLGG